MDQLLAAESEVAALEVVIADLLVGAGIPPDVSRPPLPHELGVDFLALDRRIVEQSEIVKALLVAGRAQAIRALGDTLLTLATADEEAGAVVALLEGWYSGVVTPETLLLVEARLQARLVDLLERIAVGAGQQTVEEIEAQGLTPGDTLSPGVRDEITRRARQAAVETAQSALRGMRDTVERDSGALTRTPAQLIEVAIRGAADLSTTPLLGVAEQVVTATQAAARVAVQSGVGGDVRVYASELLDRKTCRPCSTVDGRNYPSMEAARLDYPNGQYVGCDGGPRCRGTLVVVSAAESPATRLSEPREFFHLPGKHNQQAHGRGGSGGALHRVEAEAWAADSTLPGPFYHGTTSGSARDAILASGFSDAETPRVGNPLGAGVYVTRNRRMALGYAKDDESKVIEARVKVSRVASQADMMALNFRSRPADQDVGDFVTEQLRARGFEAVDYELLGEVVVFSAAALRPVVPDVLASAVVAFHLPGKHNQRSHGRGGSGPALEGEAAAVALRDWTGRVTGGATDSGGWTSDVAVAAGLRRAFLPLATGRTEGDDRNLPDWEPAPHEVALPRRYSALREDGPRQQVRLYRGTSQVTPAVLGRAEGRTIEDFDLDRSEDVPDDLAVNVLSSWTVDPSVAATFGNVLEADVEVRDVVMFLDRGGSAHGGSYAEAEAIVFTPTPTRRVVKRGLPALKPEVAASGIEAFHLPGKHDQQAHGRGGSDGEVFEGQLRLPADYPPPPEPERVEWPGIGGHYTWPDAEDPADRAALFWSENMDNMSGTKTAMRNISAGRAWDDGLAAPFEYERTEGDYKGKHWKQDVHYTAHHLLSRMSAEEPVARGVWLDRGMRVTNAEEVFAPGTEFSHDVSSFSTLGGDVANAYADRQDLPGQSVIMSIPAGRPVRATHLKDDPETLPEQWATEVLVQGRFRVATAEWEDSPDMQDGQLLRVTVEPV